MTQCQGCGGASICRHCGKDPSMATLRCPACAQMNIPEGLFCCQACFKDSWPKHKLQHSVKVQVQPSPSVSGEDGVPAIFRNFQFTGKVRPASQTPQRKVPVAIAKPDYADSGVPYSEQEEKRSHHIPVLNAEKANRMREACSIGRDALDLAGSMVKPGVTGDAIDKAVHDFIISKNAYPSPLNYFNFPKSCCISVNEVICHGIPDMRPLEDGDIVNIDVSVYYKGMHADLNETFFVGTNIDKDSRRLVEGTYLSLMESIKMCKPGMLYRDLGQTIQRIASLHQLTVVKTYVGHGVGELFHCNPNVPHYYPNKAVGVMRAGHCFTIEPMLNLGTYKDKIWPDQWTSVTVDGKRSAQFEHTLLVTETGVEILTARKPESPSMGFDAEAVLDAWTKREAATNKSIVFPSMRSVSSVRRLFSTRQPSRVLETWEEVERNRPRVPTLEGYMRPAKAPQQQDIPREEFHRFMMGRAPKIPEQWRAFVGGFVLFSWCIGACAFTMYKLRPDDFEWLEEERNKAEAAKARLAKKLAAATAATNPPSSSI